MINPELLSKIYTDDLYVVHEAGINHTTSPVSPILPAENESGKAPEQKKKPVKIFDHLILSDIEPTPDQKELLGKILQAVGLSIEKVKMIVGINFPEDLQSKNLISFNVISPEVSSSEKYKIIETGSGKVLLSDSLAVLETDVSRKKALWQALQKMYTK